MFRIWLSASAITTVLSHSHKCGHSMVPSAEEMGIKTKQYNLDYNNFNTMDLSDSELFRRRMGTEQDVVYDERDQTLDYANMDNIISCDDITTKEGMRIYVNYQVMEFQEKKMFGNANGCDATCEENVKNVMIPAKQLMSAVVNWFGDHFSLRRGPVQNSSLPIEFDWIHDLKTWNEQGVANGNHAGSYTWPQQYQDEFDQWVRNHPQTDGPYDAILYVNADDHFPCGDTTTLAWAFATHRDQYGRPTYGVVNFCARALREVRAGNYIDAVDTLLHETGHVLVMTNDHFKYFDTPGLPAHCKMNTDCLIEQDENGHNWLTTPKAKELAANFWNCPTVKGIPIENQGGEGTGDSHFDQRYLQGDHNVGIVFHEKTTTSPFFLATAYDSGWYCVRPEDGSSYFTFGKDKGCGFIDQACINDKTDQSNWPEFYCDGGDANPGTVVHNSGCTYDGYSKAECKVVHGDLTDSGRIREWNPILHRGIGESWMSLGHPGLPSLNNKCPWYDGLRVGDTNKPQLCFEDLGDFHGRCIESKQSTDNKFEGNCYNIDCAEQDWDSAQKHFKKLTITVDEQMGDIVECNREDFNSEKVSTTGVSINCPSIDQYCPNSKPFECQYGAWDEGYQCCICDVGFTGDKCDVHDDCIMTYTPEDKAKVIGWGLQPCSDTRIRTCGMIREQNNHPGVTTTIYSSAVPDNWWQATYNKNTGASPDQYQLGPFAYFMIAVIIVAILYGVCINSE